MESRHILCRRCREEILDTLAAMEHQESEEDRNGGNGEGQPKLH